MNEKKNKKNKLTSYETDPVIQEIRDYDVLNKAIDYVE